MDYPHENIAAIREQLNQKLLASTGYAAALSKVYTREGHTEDGYAALLCALEDSLGALDASRKFVRIVDLLASAQQASHLANHDGFHAPVAVV